MGNLSVLTIRLLRSCIGLDCQWTALKPGTEFWCEEETKTELRKMFRVDGDEAADDYDDSVVPDGIQAMYDKPVTMSALGGMIW